MFVEVGGAAAKLAWEHKDSLLEIAKKLGKLIKNGNTNVVVFGSGGVGKTTLGHLLSGNLDPEAKHIDYIESETTEDFPIKARVFGTILVSAGQERRRIVSWPALFQKLSAGKITGIINVVAWGCHSVEALDNYKEHKIYKEWKQANKDQELPVEQFVDLFQKEMQKQELEALEFIQPHIESSKGRVWMITVVSKQDLWWDKRNAVKDFYQTGPYETLIAEITKKRGAGNFYHEYVSVSLKWENLATEKEVLMPTVSGYDDNIQRANMAKLSQALRQLVENSSK